MMKATLMKEWMTKYIIFLKTTPPLSPILLLILHLLLTSIIFYCSFFITEYFVGTADFGKDLCGSDFIGFCGLVVWMVFEEGCFAVGGFALGGCGVMGDIQNVVGIFFF
eukprot:11067497-Ditylum_brightwellii.AAC.1